MAHSFGLHFHRRATRERDIDQYNVRTKHCNLLERIVSIRNDLNFMTVMLERQLNDFLNRHAVICYEKSHTHG
jgi:hypothetical protein